MGFEWNNEPLCKLMYAENQKKMADVLEMHLSFLSIFKTSHMTNLKKLFYLVFN